MITGNINGNSIPFYTGGEIMYDFWKGGVYAPPGHICWRPSDAVGRVVYNSNTTVRSESISGGDLDCTPYIPNMYFINCTWSEIGVNIPSTTQWARGMFMSCSTLKRATLYNCSNVGSDAFAGCYNLSMVQADECRVVQPAAFIACYSLKYISLPKCRAIGLDAFALCSSLERLNFPLVSVFVANAFDGCRNLSMITFGYSGVVSVLELSAWGEPFIGGDTKIGSNMGSIYVPSTLVSRYKSDSAWSYYSNVIYPIQS